MICKEVLAYSRAMRLSTRDVVCTIIRRQLAFAELELHGNGMCNRFVLHDALFAMYGIWRYSQRLTHLKSGEKRYRLMFGMRSSHIMEHATAAF